MKYLFINEFGEPSQIDEPTEAILELIFDREGELIVFSADEDCFKLAQVEQDEETNEYSLGDWQPIIEGIQ